MTSTFEDRTLLAADVAIKAPCRAATTAAITLSGLQTVDGIALVANDRVLVKNQASGSANGIYLASTGSWTRTADFDGNRDVVDGTLVFVRLGTANALALYMCSAAVTPAVIGTTSLAFNLISVVVGNAGVFTTISASGQITSSVVTGTAPLVIASTTKVANLNADLLDGTDWNAPGPIGAGTPSTGAFTTLSATGNFTGGGTGKIATTFGVGNATPAATGSGVSFPATQAPSSDANTMDDYEEGTWTPSLGGSTTYSLQQGTYTKAGRLVFITGEITVNAIGTGSTTTISGLPFAAASTFTHCLSVASSANCATAVVSITAAINSGASSIVLGSRTAASASEGSSAIFQNTTVIKVSGCYQTT